MKARIPLALALTMLLLVGMLALVSPSQAQDTGPSVVVLENMPESVFVFQVSPTTAQLGQTSIWIMYAWGYLGDPAQELMVRTTFPAGVDPGGCPSGCVRIMHILRDPYGGAGISATIPATATVVGEHTMVAYFEDDLGVSQTLTATLTVVEPPPTVVHLSGMSATPSAPQIPWTLIIFAVLVFMALGISAFRRVRVHN